MIEKYSRFVVEITIETPSFHSKNFGVFLVAVQDAVITPHTLNFMNKLVSTFGVGIENVSSVSSTYSSAASESLARRAQATAQDPVFQKMKSQFTTDFDFK
jgi:transformation/transcription domain-associated protein